MDGATPMTDIRTQETAIQKLTDEIVTMCIPEKHQLEMDNSEKDKVISELTIKVDAEEARQASTLTQETQTDRDDIEHYDAIFYTPRSQSSNNDYVHDIPNMWHKILIERPPGAEPPGHSNTGHIYVYNTNMVEFYQFYPAFPAMLSYEPGAKIYYHGSNDRNVKHILENGIDVTQSTRATDFSCGDGFYLTKDRYKAVEWSRKRACWKRGRPAIIAFKISPSLRKEEPHLALKVDTTTHRKWWECVVSHFRRSGRSADVRNALKDVKFIKGPVANNKYLGDEEIPRPLVDFTQFCIRHQEYANRFGSLKNIAFVMFLV